ncbi:MAG: cupin domain-containing protein [Bacteroidetes bacterium]|nr:cupin domain-containing protein [Bacteroidota bacterium]
MKYCLAWGFLFFTLSATSQPALVTNVYSWNPSGEMFRGRGEVLLEQILSGHVIPPGKSYLLRSSEKSAERLLIVWEGIVEGEVTGKVCRLDRGSVVFLLPGDAMILRNPSTIPASVHIMEMLSDKPDFARGRSAGSSFAIASDEMRYRSHDRGGVRQLFDRPTVHFARFDIHITTLNPRLSSHAPHTHRNEEVILLLEGEGEMVHGSERRRIVAGGAAWVGSMVPHNITNIGDRPAVYYAIQWN